MYSRKPKWWTLYAIVPLMLIALFVILGQRWADWEKTAAIVAVIVCSFGGMAVWMGANEGTILRAEVEQERRAEARRKRLITGQRFRPIAHAATAKTLPATGFGSARFRGSYRQDPEAASGGYVRIVKRIDPSHRKEF